MWKALGIVCVEAVWAAGPQNELSRSALTLGTSRQRARSGLERDQPARYGEHRPSRDELLEQQLPVLAAPENYTEALWGRGPSCVFLRSSGDDSRLHLPSRTTASGGCREHCRCRHLGKQCQTSARQRDILGVGWMTETWQSLFAQGCRC